MSEYSFSCPQCGLVKGILVKVQKTPFDIELSDAGGIPIITPDLPHFPNYELVKMNNRTEYRFICADCGKIFFVTDDIIDSGKTLKKFGCIVEV